MANGRETGGWKRDGTASRESGDVHEIGKPPFSVQVLDSEWWFCGSLSGSTSGRRKGAEMSWLVTVEDLRRGSSAEALMGSEESVVVESELKAAFELVLDEGREGLEQGEGLQCPPESFQDSDGADLSDGAEALADVEAVAGVAEELGGKLAGR